MLVAQERHQNSILIRKYYYDLPKLEVRERGAHFLTYLYIAVQYLSEYVEGNTLKGVFLLFDFFVVITGGPSIIFAFKLRLNITVCMTFQKSKYLSVNKSEILIKIIRHYIVFPAILT